MTANANVSNFLRKSYFIVKTIMFLGTIRPDQIDLRVVPMDSPIALDINRHIYKFFSLSLNF
jgi:hypothetical protein